MLPELRFCSFKGNELDVVRAGWKICVMKSFMVCVLTKYFLSGQIKADILAWLSAYVGQKFVHGCHEDARNKQNVEDVGVVRRVVLKWILVN
jgi:hypothetical protein